ncbi:MAG: hypothetical protein ACJARO_000204 [Bacteriovoracaceae bacterium]
MIEEYLDGRTFEVDKMGQEGIKFIKEFHTPKIMNKRLEELYSRILN